MERAVPKFMTEKRDIVRFLFFVFIWAVVFIFIYHPEVSIRTVVGLHFTEYQYVYYVTMLIFVGYIILILSRILFYKLNKLKHFTFFQFTTWIIVEMLLISLGLSLLGWSLNEPNTRPFLMVLPRTTISVISLLFIPYLVCWLYFSLEEKKRMLREIENKKTAEVEKGLINFVDEKGVFRLSIRLDDFLYVQSADNYVYIYYLNNKQQKVQFMLRNSLKCIEESFPNLNLIRCHRFYVVNLRKVRVLRKTKEGLMLELDTEPACDIPVSKTYAERVAELFTKA